MRWYIPFIAGIAALGLSACVVVPTGVPTSGNTGPTLTQQVAGQSFVNVQTGQALFLFSDGSYTVQANGQQSYGTWRAIDATASMCFTGPVASYARGACIPIRYDGDYLTLFNASQTQAMEAWEVSS